MDKPLWIYRPLLNWREVYLWCHDIGVKKILPHEQLHATLATVRQPVDWNLISPHCDEITVPAGHKVIQIFGYTIKAMAFGHEDFKARHEQLLEIYPSMDHPLLRPHVSLYRGGRLPREAYLGELIFGPEQIQEFDETEGSLVKHVPLLDYL